MARKKGDFAFKFTDEQLKQMESLAAIGTPLDDIAAEMGCGKDTLERRMKEDTKIKTALKRGRRRAEMKARKCLYDMAFVDKSVPMAIFWAKTQLGWKEQKQEIEITNVGPAPILKFGLLSPKSPEMKAAKEKYIDQPKVKKDEDEEES